MDIRCQQFTSQNIASEMLDLLEYRENLYGKKLLENSCGEGNILCIAVERYIQDAIQRGYNSKEIVLGLEKDICGAEIIEETYRKCIYNLDKIANEYSLGKVRWNIFYGDVLLRPFTCKFNYVIGNPPYISYKNLEKKDREYIKKEYSTCAKGKPDYCYAFIENSIQYLSEEGKMVYLIPNSIYKNVYASKLRELILEYIEEIKDYPNQKLFSEAMTSSAIMLLKKGRYIPKLKYVNVSEDYIRYIDKNELTDKWVFIEGTRQSECVRFGEYFKASMAVATQRNNVFVLSEEKIKKYKIEKDVLRPAVSPRNKKYNNTEYIIFPYKIQNNKVINYTEKEFSNKFPRVYTYLLENKEELQKRAADISAKWFEFGRSQALQNMNREKLLVSTVVTNQVGVYKVSEKEIPYAGIYIFSEYGMNLDIAKNILESDSFLQYIKGIGTPASGNSLRITANDINNYMCSVNLFVN